MEKQKLKFVNGKEVVMIGGKEVVLEKTDDKQKELTNQLKEQFSDKMSIRKARLVEEFKTFDQSDFRNYASFDLKIVPESRFIMNSTCPHCRTEDQPIKMFELDEDNVAGDFMVCDLCTRPFLVLQFPVMLGTGIPPTASFEVKKPKEG